MANATIFVGKPIVEEYGSSPEELSIRKMTKI